MGRYATLVRWNIEKLIADISQRYSLFKNRIPWYFIPYVGCCLRYCISTHTMFSIGVIKPSKLRRKTLFFLKLKNDKWLKKAPFTQEQFKIAVNEVKRPSIYWKEVNSVDDVLNVWKNSVIESFLFSDEQMHMFAGGPANVKKALYALDQSKHRVKLFVGVGKRYGELACDGIVQKMRVPKEDGSGIFHY